MTTDLLGERCAFRYAGDERMTGIGWIRALYPNPDGIHIAHVVVEVERAEAGGGQAGDLVEFRIDFVRVLR